PVAEHADSDAIALLSPGVEQHHVRNVQRRLLLDDAAGHASRRIRPLVPLHDVHVLHHDAVVAEHTGDETASALVAARDHDNLVAFLNALHRPAPTALPAQAR